MRVDRHILQIWYGDPPSARIHQCMELAQSQGRDYTLIADSNFLKTRNYLRPENFEASLARWPDVLSAYRIGDARHRSDIMRYYLLTLYPGLCYLDCDCVFTRPVSVSDAHTYFAYTGQGPDYFIIITPTDKVAWKNFCKEVHDAFTGYDDLRRSHSWPMYKAFRTHNEHMIPATHYHHLRASEWEKAA